MLVILHLWHFKTPRTPDIAPSTQASVNADGTAMAINSVIKKKVKVLHNIGGSIRYLCKIADKDDIEGYSTGHQYMWY